MQIAAAPTDEPGYPPASNFKSVVAALDTLPFYLGVRVLSRVLQIDPSVEHPEVEL